MVIDLVEEKDFEQIHLLIAKTCKISFANYYPQKFIEKTINALKPDTLRERAKGGHFYIAKEDEKILGCGAVAPYWGSETESVLLTIFVDPDCQGKGIGRKLIETLENDEYSLRSKRIEIPAGIVGIPFYKKMGYDFKNGELIYDDGHFAMEKFR